MHARDYRNVLNSKMEAFAIIDRVPGDSFRVLDVNREWERFVGRSREECLAQPLDRILPSSLAARVGKACERCTIFGETLELQVQVPLAAGVGTQVWKLTPLGEPSSKAGRIVLVARTVPSSSMVLSSDVQFRNTLEQTADFIAQYDREGRILYCNTPGIRNFTFEPSAMMGTTPERWPDIPDVSRYHEALINTVRTRKPQAIEFTIDLSDGRAYCQVRFAPERGADGEVISVVAVGRDITALRRTEEKLRRSEQQFRTLAEHSPDCILRFDRELRVIYCNPVLFHLTGIPAEDFIGTRIGELRIARKVASEGGNAGVMADAITRVIREQKPLQLELREMNPRLPGGTGCVNFAMVPEFDESGRIESVLAIGRDIKELKAIEAELRSLNATLEERVAARTRDLEHANRDLQSFAQTVSHDLRSPLRAIVGFARAISEEESDRLSAEGRELLERICAAGTKLNQFIDDILQYSHAGQAALSRHPIALDQLAQDVAAELQVQYPSAAVAVSELPQVHGDPTMLRQVLQNLIGNALKFSAQRSQPRVEVDFLHQDGEIVFYVRDNGAGFDMRHADKLGGMFQRLHTEREFPGSGVGLAIVHRLIERHGGRVWAQSEVGAGATFFFTLPSSTPEVQPGER